MLDRLSHTHIARSMPGHRKMIDIPRNFRRASSTLAHNPTPASIEDDARVKGISK